jgi:hypothetical protein
MIEFQVRKRRSGDIGQHLSVDWAAASVHYQ